MKRTLLYFISIMIIGSICTNGQATSVPYKWVNSPSGPLEEMAYGITTDYAGANTYVTGKFQSKPLNMGNGITITHTGMKDYFVAKYNGQGECVWAHEGGGDVTTEGRDVVIDQDGNIAVTGGLYGNSIFGGIPLVGSGNWDVVVVKYNPNGDVLWAKKGSSYRQDRGNGITIDNLGNYLVVGYFGGAGVDTANFNGYKLTGYGDRDIFVAKYNTNGDLLWVKAAGSSSSGEEGWGIAVDNDNNIYIAGMYQGTANFGTLQTTGMAGKDVFVSKLSPNGDFLWVKTLLSPKDIVVADLEISTTKDEIAIAGYFTDTVIVNNVMQFSNGSEDAFVARYSLDGMLNSLYHFGGALADRASGISAAGGNKFWVVGNFYGTMTLGGTTLASSGDRDAFMTLLDNNNDHIYFNVGGGTSDDFCTDVSCDGAGNAFVTGYYNNTANFGSFQVTSAGDDEMYVARIGDFIVPVELISFNAENIDGKVNLNWVTATETNNYGFDIERSFDKIRFEKIAFINGKGTSSVINNYNYVDNTNFNGVVYYRLKQTDFDGTHHYSDIVEVNTEIPANFALMQNYPNPFNPTTTITYTLKSEGFVTIKIFDVLGKEVETIVNQIQNRGTYKLTFNAANINSGIYFYNLTVSDKLSGNSIFNQSKKMILVK